MCRTGGSSLLLLLALGVSGCKGCKSDAPAAPPTSAARPPPAPAKRVARPDTRTSEQRVREVVAQQLGQEVHRAPPEMKLSDLGASDLDKVEIVMALEDEFEAKISEEDAARLTTMGDLLTWAAARKPKP